MEDCYSVQNMKKASDLDLITSAINGDASSFEQIINKYEAQVSATIYGMLGDTQEADDVGQEVFIRFYKSMDKFRGDSALGTYLTRIAINLSLNEIKRRKRRQFFSFDTPIEKELSELYSDKESNKLETKELVQMALLKLDPKFRSVVVLRLVENYSTDETAIILELPVGTVLSRLARGQKKLKQILSPFMEEM
ncbi:MAG: RNA polymerase sigma factor [Melioribacteraceae bacterium]|nr:RNA polymerase sigma factor [Melioribacteraceae bacterium]